jgi:HK97 family phage portal protein
MILKTRNQGTVEHYAFALTDMVRWGYTGLRGAGLRVSTETVQGIPAINRAARIRAEALASLRLRCWRGEAPSRTRADNVWQAKLFAGAANEYQSRFVFWETIGESLAYRNNAYIWKNVNPDTGQILEWYALHPDQVECKGPDGYIVHVRQGYLDPTGRGTANYQVDEHTILHIRGHGNGGTYEAPSPIQVFREALASPIERQRHEANWWRKGTAVRLAAVFPQGVSKEQVDEFRPLWQETYEGGGGDTTAIIGGGADLKPIGLTARDAEFVGMAHLTVEDAARIMGVPTDLLDLQIGQRTAPGTLEDTLTRWYVFGLGPELDRIESQLSADFELFGNGSRTTPGFEADRVVRGDVKTEDDIAHQQIQDGRMLVNEWRNERGLKPIPGGDVPQLTPVGGAPNIKQPIPVANGNGKTN